MSIYYYIYFYIYYLALFHCCYHEGFLGDSVVKNPPVNAGNVSSIPGSGRFPGVRNGSPLQYSCLENSMDRGGYRTSTVHRVTKR